MDARVRLPRNRQGIIHGTDAFNIAHIPHELANNVCEKKNQQRRSENNLVFMNNRGGALGCAGVWSICGGNGQSFADADVSLFIFCLDVVRTTNVVGGVVLETYFVHKRGIFDQLAVFPLPA